MAYCPQCGEALDEGARFCAECGAPVEGARPAPGGADAGAVAGDAAPAAPGAPAATAAMPAAPRDAAPARPDATAAAPDATAAMPPAAGADAARRAADAARAMDALGGGAGGVRPVTGPVSVGSGSTRRMPAVATPQARPVGSRRPVTYSARNTVRRSRVPLVVGIVVAALLVGAGAFAVVTWANRDHAGGGAAGTSFLSDGAADAPAPPAPDPEPADGRAPATAERLPGAQDDAQAALAAYYGELPGLDGRVSAAAQEFNGLYVSGSLEERRAALGRCEALRADIAEARDEVAALGIPADSPYRGCAADIAALYEDLWQRIDVIVRSWEVDVGFEDPAGHSDEICAPMAAANEGGVNRYLRDYQERYPGADPARVEA